MEATAWVGGIEHNQVSPCPAVAQINEEIYYTERLMLAIDRARDQLPERIDLGQTETRLASAENRYNRLLDAPVTSLDAFTSEAEMVRYQLGKVYSAISQKAIENVKRTRVLWAAIGVSVVVVASLIWGWVNTQNALRTPQLVLKKDFKTFLPIVLVLILIFVFFALPIFRLPSQTVTVTDAEEQERQMVLDETARAASTGDRELSRVWMLGKIGSIYAQNDLTVGKEILEEALTAAEEAQNNAYSLWGFSQSAWEAGGADYSKKAEASLVVSDLDAARGRVWGLRLIAVSWSEVDQAEALAILEKALFQLENAVYPYVQLELRALSVALAKLDPERGVSIAKGINDPALRSWAFREIAVLSGEAALFDVAAEAARQVSDPVQKTRSLREIGSASGVASYFDQAAGALQGVQGAALAYALADLSAAANDASLAALIPDDFPAAQAFAYYGLGDYQNAWESSTKISDPFEQTRAQAAIAAAWENTEAALQITNPLMRDRALCDISIKTGQISLVELMENSYYQVQALTAAELYKEAWQIAEELEDGYPLVTLGVAMAEHDTEIAAQMIDSLSRESDKAVVWRAIAATTSQQEHFERALGMALAARVRGDALSPAQASLDLANAFISDPERFEAALYQAYNAAQMINIIY